LSLKETGNRVVIEGVLNSKSFEIKKDSEGKEFITGQIDVKTGKENIIPVNVFSYAKKKDGSGDNSIFKGLQTVFNDTTAISETNDPEQATKIRITAGSIRVDEFKGQDGNITSAVKYNTNFINRISDDSYDPKATFEIEMIVQKFRPEVKDDEETGDGFIDGFIVNYNGDLYPLTLKAPKKIYSKLEDKVEKNDVIIFWGEVINSIETKKIHIEADFGDDQDRIITNTKRERLVSGAKFSTKDIEEDDLKEAFKQREKHLKALQDKGKFDKKVQEKEENSIDDDDLPFTI
jgi:hypothetical protein